MAAGWPGIPPLRGSLAMLIAADAPRSFWLTLGMARAAGADLAGAVAEGWLERRELAALVAACAACGRGAACRDWLADGGEGGAPAGCPNAGVLAGLAR